MRRFAMALAAVMAVGVGAQAQAKIDRPPMPFEDPKCPNGVKGGGSQSDEGRDLRFDGVDVDGCVEKPGGGTMQGKPNVNFPSMIKVRANFSPELQKTANQL